MERRPINIPECIGKYEVTEDGRVFQIHTQRLLKPSVSNYGYIKYSLIANDGMFFSRHRSVRQFSSHRLAAFAFIGSPPTKYHTDCHHKDHDKTNNHWSNLEWVTHSENLLRSWSETDRVSPRSGKKFGPHSTETIALMRKAKEKSCYAEINGERREYGSVQDLMDDLGIYRKAFNRAVKSGNPYRGITLGFV